MKRLKYTVPHNPISLEDELIAAIPSLAPVVVSGEKLPGVNGPLKQAVMVVYSSGNDVFITVPDETDESAVAAVVQAHTNPPPPPPVDYGNDVEDTTNRVQFQAAIDNLRAYRALSSPTAAQTVAALKLLIGLVLAMARRML